MRGSIRTRLTLAFIGLAIGPLLLVGVILTWQSFTTQEHQALNLQREVAQRVSSQVKAFLDGLENELRLVSRVQGLQTLDRDTQRNILAELLTYQDAFESLNLLDSQGQEQVRLARSKVIPAEELRNRAGADEFVIPQTSGRVYYSSVHFDETTGESFVTIAVPLLDVRTGLVDGVLVSEVRLRRIWDLIMNLRTSPGQSVYIVDTLNQVVAHRNPSVVLRGTIFHVPDQDGIQPGLASVSPLLAVNTREGLSIQSLVARFTSPNVVLAVATIRCGEQALHIIAEQTVSDALVLAITTVLITAILLVAAFMMASGLGFLIMRQIVRPIQAMATTAEAISTGDLSQQVQGTNQDELGVLANAFNSMTTRLRTIITGLEQQVAERKRAEHALRESEERLRQIASSLRETIWLRDVQTRQVLYVNPAFEELTGRTCESFYENRDIMKDAIHPDDKEWVSTALEQRFEGIPFDIEHRIIHLDGSVHWVSSRSVPVRNKAGDVYRWASIMEDITERKRTEDEIRRLNAELETRVKARTTELEFANRELKDFAYAVSHDLKAPLRAISRLASWLSDDYASAFDDKGHEMIEVLINRVKRMDGLIDGILEYSRIGRVGSVRIPVDLNQLVADVLDSLAPPDHVHITVAHQLPTLMVEKTRIFQVFQNLIGNAMKFMDKPQGTIDIGCVEDAGYWRFSVADNGPGIDPKHHDRIFQIFQTLRPRDEFESTGIGLTLVKKIVELYGGKIWLESTIEEGSTFFFTIPKNDHS